MVSSGARRRHGVKCSKVWAFRFIVYRVIIFTAFCCQNVSEFHPDRRLQNTQSNLYFDIAIWINDFISTVCHPQFGAELLIDYGSEYWSGISRFADSFHFGNLLWPKCFALSQTTRQPSQENACVRFGLNWSWLFCLFPDISVAAFGQARILSPFFFWTQINDYWNEKCHNFLNEFLWFKGWEKIPSFWICCRWGVCQK